MSQSGGAVGDEAEINERKNLEDQLTSSLSGVSNIIHSLGLEKQFPAAKGNARTQDQSLKPVHAPRGSEGGAADSSEEEEEEDNHTAASTNGKKSISRKRPLEVSTQEEEVKKRSSDSWSEEDLARTIMQISQNQGRGGNSKATLSDNAAGAGYHGVDHHASGELTTAQSTGPRRDKGLRSFSLKVCQKVEEKSCTTYAQVADELVQEFKQDESANFDEKNIRRRVYDALNVLMAIDIITKDKKHIRWKGFPQSLDKERQLLENVIEDKKRELGEKKQQVEDRALQLIHVSNLIKRNEAWLKAGKIPATHECMRVPFVVVKASLDNLIDCEQSEDRQEALINCSSSFELHDDVVVLKRMDLSYVEDEAEALARFQSCPGVCPFLLQRRPGLLKESKS